MIVTRSYVRKLEFCNLIGAFTFQYAAILLDQEIRHPEEVRHGDVTSIIADAAVAFSHTFSHSFVRQERPSNKTVGMFLIF